MKNINSAKEILRALFFSLGLFLPIFVLAVQAPTVLTQEAQNITATSTTLVGQVTDCGGCCQLRVWFEWGLDIFYGNETPPSSLSHIGSFSANLSNLSPCTLYHFRAVARNNRYTGYGQDKTFTTSCPPPTVDIKANNSDGPITISYNSSATLSWTSQNATSCQALGDWSGSKAISGSESTGNLTSDKTYTISCTGPGGSAQDSVTVNVTPNNPPVADAGPDKEVYEEESVVLEGSGSDPDGDPITYSWSCSGGSLSDATISQPIFYAPSVSQDTTYTCTLTVTDIYGAAVADSMDVLVKVHESPTLSVDLQANPFAGCSPVSNVDLTATVSGTAKGNITYFFDCQNDGIWEKIETKNYTPYTAHNLCNFAQVGSYMGKVRVEREGLAAEDTVQINVYSCHSPPTVDIKANNSDGPITISYNSSATLSWTSSNATFCQALGDWSGSKAISGSESTGNLTSDKTYTISCTGPGGSVSDSVTVKVETQPNPDLEITKWARNKSKGETSWKSLVQAKPDDLLAIKIKIESVGDSLVKDVIVKDILPEKVDYLGLLEIGGERVYDKDITKGINIGDLSLNESKIITFNIKLASGDSFSYGTTVLINKATVYGKDVDLISDRVEIRVTKTKVAGVLDIPTGLTNNILVDSILLPLIIASIIIWIFKSHILCFEEWLEKRKKRWIDFRAKRLLLKEIAQIRARETLK